MRIKAVAKDSLGARSGLKPGDRLLKINGRRVIDHLDYHFRIHDPALELEIERDSQRQVIRFVKDEDTDLGIEFEDFTIRSCANDCIFCFVDQNPEGLRKGLYFRDGDYRMSFLYGHYITMTNMGKRDLQRIVEQRLSPLYISIHATDPQLRRRMFLYGKDDHLLTKMRFLVDNRITLYGQIVLCPTFNDGSQLIRTLEDLLPLAPGLRSVAIVPVGLTAHRDGLVAIPPVTKAYARSFLEDYRALDRRYRSPDGLRFIVPSDEWYILTGTPLPQAAFYRDISMEENGVGHVRDFLDRFAREQKKFPKAMDRPTRFTIATGVLAERIFREHVLPDLNVIRNLTVDLQVVHNTLFGELVTVAGLLSGRDFVSQLGGRDLGDAVWATHRILNNEGELTLDDMTLPQISKQLGVPLNIARDSILEIFRRGIRG